MSKTTPLICLSFVIITMGLFWACVRDSILITSTNEPLQPQLTIMEARNFFEHHPVNQKTRAEQYECDNPFVLGSPLLLWDEAAVSTSQNITSVDIPVVGEKIYRIVRKDVDGVVYSVKTHAKIIVVRSHETQQLETYIRVCIPDKLYSDFYDGNICNLSLNCENRFDYCGLELYLTLDGWEVAVARYFEGRMIDCVYLFDSSLSLDERKRRFARMMGDIWVFPEKPSTRGTTSNNITTPSLDEEWDYGEPGSTFYGTDGTKYIYLPNGQVTTYDIWMEILRFETSLYGGTVDVIVDGGSDGENGWSTGFDDDSGSESNNESGNGNGCGGESNGTGNNSFGGGGSSDGSNGDSDDGSNDSSNGGSDDGFNADVSGDTTIQLPYFNNPIKVNPIDNPITPIIPKSENGSSDDDDDADDVEEDEEKIPCVDSLNMEANPMTEMQISDDNLSWKSNTWGYVRNGGTRFHDGLDLKAETGITKVYSMFDGVVVKVVSEQPNRISNNKYPSDYDGIDRDGAGNRIIIRSKLPNGEYIQIGYWHLDTADKNPYTKTFSCGDEVKQGQIIGIVGNTGNAYNKKPHLHLKTYIENTNSKIDDINNPMNYIYTKYDEDGTIIRDC